MTRWRLPEGEFHILLSLLAGPAYGLAINREIRRHCGHDATLAPGTLYVSLKRLRDRGLIAESGRGTRSVPYRITADGERALANEWSRRRRTCQWASRRVATNAAAEDPG